MTKKKFLSIKRCYNVYQSCFKAGLIVAPNKVKGKYLYIIGIDIAYDDIYWLDYCKFIIISLSEFEIISVFRNIFGEEKLKKRQNNQVNIHNLLYEILIYIGFIQRANNICKFFNIKELKTYSIDEICKFVDFYDSENNQQIGYKHIDINTGLRFYGENTYDINGNILT